MFKILNAKVSKDCPADMSVRPIWIFLSLKKCTDEDIKMTSFESIMEFSQFKTNEQGLIPVVVQHYRTQEVLMLAYMNQESFDATIKTGKMTYYSRSRKSLWVKGETSGHFQYVKSLTIDCDYDTLLAKVDQVGLPAIREIQPAFPAFGRKGV